jgi:hypothetical protein
MSKCTKLIIIGKNFQEDGGENKTFLTLTNLTSHTHACNSPELGILSNTCNAPASKNASDELP